VVGKTKGQSLLGRPKLGRQDNIKLYINEIGWEAGGKWWAVVWAVVNF